MNDTNDQFLSWVFDKQPIVFKFDPDRQIVLKAGGTVVGVDESTLLAVRTTLDQNRPNPASIETRISYSIDKPAAVKLEVTDMLGIVIKRLVDKTQQAGNYEIMLDCSALPAGNYLYKLSAGNTRQVKKLVIIR
jgi:hypothetical protein